MSLKEQWRLLGNGLHIPLVAALLRNMLLPAAPSTHSAFAGAPPAGAVVAAAANKTDDGSTSLAEVPKVRACTCLFGVPQRLLPPHDAVDICVRICCCTRS